MVQHYQGNASIDVNLWLGQEIMAPKLGNWIYLNFLNLTCLGVISSFPVSSFYLFISASRVQSTHGRYPCAPALPRWKRACFHTGGSFHRHAGYAHTEQGDATLHCTTLHYTALDCSAV